MVLQRAPESAVVWGFCDEPGTRIIATFRGQALPAVVPDGAGVWRVRLPPNAPTSVPTTILFDGVNGVVSLRLALKDVIFGDVPTRVISHYITNNSQNFDCSFT